jgi:hypothetical protein
MGLVKQSSKEAAVVETSHKQIPRICKLQQFSSNFKVAGRSSVAWNRRSLVAVPGIGFALCMRVQLTRLECGRTCLVVDEARSDE